MLEAAKFVRTLEKRRGFGIAWPEEIALSLGFISPTEFEALAHGFGKSGYGTDLRRLVPDAAPKKSKLSPWRSVESQAGTFDKRKRAEIAGGGLLAPLDDSKLFSLNHLGKWRAGENETGNRYLIAGHL